MSFWAGRDDLNTINKIKKNKKCVYFSVCHLSTICSSEWAFAGTRSKIRAACHICLHIICCMWSSKRTLFFKVRGYTLFPSRICRRFHWETFSTVMLHTLVVNTFCQVPSETQLKAWFFFGLRYCSEMIIMQNANGLVRAGSWMEAAVIEDFSFNFRQVWV